MNTSDALIKNIYETKTFHRFLELDLEKAKLQELLKKALVTNSTQLFRTRKARDLLTQITTKLKSFTSSPYTKLLVHTLLPTRDTNEITKRQKLCEQALNLKIPLDIFKNLLSQIITLTYSSSKKHNGTCIAFADEDQYLAKRSELSKKFYVTLVESEQDLMSIDHYEHIRFIKKNHSTLTRSAEIMPQVSVIDSHDVQEIAPEFVTDILEEHQLALIALEQLQEQLQLNHHLPKNPSLGKRASFQNIQITMNELFAKFQTFLSDTISQSNFSGQQLITIVNKQQSILDYLDPDSLSLIHQEKNILLKTLEELTQLSCLELFTITSLGELSIDEKRLSELEKEYYSSQEESLYLKKVELANEWSSIIPLLPQFIEEVYRYDLLMTLKQFIERYELSKPTLAQEGISFLYGKNMNIEGATPIEYHVGVKDQVAIITGANSGGKTTLLELLGQIQILTHMGLYVPAKEAQVGLVEEIYYFSKNKGSLSAGAFETLLKQFSGISDDDSRKLILADEIESVTEPDVAAKIIKGIISHLRSSKHNILILVTHMGRELEKLEVQGRFDGIEAKGLDEDLNLVVDRNPVIGRVARSTPQLIIDRLAQIHKTPFYIELKKLVV